LVLAGISFTRGRHSSQCISQNFYSPAFPRSPVRRYDGAADQPVPPFPPDAKMAE
jgi:hypothetical protein